MASTARESEASARAALHSAEAQLASIAAAFTVGPEGAHHNHYSESATLADSVTAALQSLRASEAALKAQLTEIAAAVGESAFRDCRFDHMVIW